MLHGKIWNVLDKSCHVNDNLSIPFLFDPFPKEVATYFSPTDSRVNINEFVAWSFSRSR